MSTENAYDSITQKIKSACAGQRQPIQLVAVSKKQTAHKIRDLYSKGQKVFAENYVQEYLEKKDELSDLKIEWHFIGPIQTNKVSKIVGEFTLIHSIDSLKVLEKINQLTGQKKVAHKNTTQKVLVQVNVAKEDSKSGFDESEIKEVLEKAKALENVQVVGFMCMPPLAKLPEDSRKYFKKAAELLKSYKKEFPNLLHLSMGTTQDYEVAMQEGATFIRIGEALFGKRK